MFQSLKNLKLSQIKMKPAQFILLAVFIFLINSCSVTKAVVVDLNGLEKEVYSITTDKGEIIEVLDGRAFRRISLDQISVIKISPKQTKSFKGNLYYLTEIWLIDGSKIQSYVLPDGKLTGAYINVHTNIMAKTKNGTFEIPAKEVKQIKFMRY